MKIWKHNIRKFYPSFPHFTVLNTSTVHLYAKFQSNGSKRPNPVNPCIYVYIYMWVLMCTYARELWRSDERENQKTPNSLCTCSVCVGRLEVKVKEKEVSLSYVMPHTYAYYRVNCHSACMWFISHRKYSRKTEQNLSFFFFFWWRVENKKYRSVLWQGIDCQNIRGPNRENRKKKKQKTK